MTRYELELFENIAKLTKAICEIAKDIHEIKEQIASSKSGGGTTNDK